MGDEQDCETDPFGDVLNSGLTAQQALTLNELNLAAATVKSYPKLVELVMGFYEQIGAGAANCAIFDNRNYDLVGFSTSMRDGPLDQVEEEGIGPLDPLVDRISKRTDPALVGFGLGVTSEWDSVPGRRLVDIMDAHGYFGLLYQPVRLEGTSYSAAITIATELLPEKALVYLKQNSTLILLSARTLGMRATQLFQPDAIDDSWRPRRSAILSGRELQVVRALSHGNRPEQIAHQLNIKTVTVHMHVASARQKLGARTREQLVTTAMKLGLL